MPFPFRRIHTDQVFYKEISSPVLAVITAQGVAHARHKQQVYVFIGLDDGIYQLESGSRIHVIIHFPQDQQELPLQLVGVGHVRRFFVLPADRVAHPLLIPPDLIHAVIMAAGGRNRYFIELRMVQQGPGRALSAGRVTKDTYPADIHVRITGGRGFDPFDPVRETAVFQVLPANIMEGLGAVRGTHAVYLHHNKAQFGQLVEVSPGVDPEILRYK